MPKKTTGSVAKYAPEKSTHKRTVIAKIIVPQTDLDDFAGVYDDLLAQARKDHPEIGRCRATISLY